jgi:hypothetical protein
MTDKGYGGRGAAFGILPAVTAVLAALAFYRGFRHPGAWSLNYYQVSWIDGFVRRGLLGTLLAPLGCGRFDPTVVAGVQAAVLGLCCLLLVRLARRGGATAVLLALLLASDAGAFLMNEIGYPDQLLLAVTAAACWLVRSGRPRSASLALALAVLVHEMGLFLALPLAFVAWRSLPDTRRAHGVTVFGPAILAALLLFGLGDPLTDSTLGAYAAKAAVCGHPLTRPDFIGHFRETLADTFGWHYNRWELALQILPLVASLGLVFRGRPLWGWRWAAACAPLGLGFLGWDTGRWIFLTLMAALLLLAEEASPASGERSPRSALAAAACAVGLAVAGAATGNWFVWSAFASALVLSAAFWDGALTPREGLGRFLPLALLVPALSIPFFDGYHTRGFNRADGAAFVSELRHPLGGADAR